MRNDSRIMHETIVRDIVDVIDSVKDLDDIEWLNKRNTSGSIARRADALVLVFPVICSSSMSLESAMIISKAIERKCVSLLQILFASAQISNAENLVDYIAQFHTNLGSKMTLDTFIDTMSRLVDEGTIEITDPESYKAVMEDMKNISYTLSKDYNHTPLSNYSIKRNAYGESAVILNERGNNFTPTQDDIDFQNALANARNARAAEHTARAEELRAQYTANQSANTLLNSLNNSNRSYRDIEALNTTRNISTNTERRIDIKNTMQSNSLKDMQSYFTNQLVPSDVKKANELTPTMVTVNFISVDDSNHGDKRNAVNTTGLIGIKAKLYPVDNMEIINRLVSKSKDSNGLFNLIRATTREISFFKDFAFAVDKAKLDAINMSNRSNSSNAKMFRMLERRSAKNKLMTLARKGNASPITSLVITKEDVEYMKKYNNLDMEKMFNIRTMFNAYNIMDIVIVDESLELAKFAFDNDESFETLSFDSLEKESSDGSYKKMINLMSRIR